MDLDSDTRNKFDRVLAAVKEPQSELGIGELGLVKKIGYHPADRTLVVKMNFGNDGMDCPACWAISEHVIASIERDLTAALAAEFPGWTIEFA